MEERGEGEVAQSRWRRKAEPHTHTQRRNQRREHLKDHLNPRGACGGGWGKEGLGVPVEGELECCSAGTETQTRINHHTHTRPTGAARIRSAEVTGLRAKGRQPGGMRVAGRVKVCTEDGGTSVTPQPREGGGGRVGGAQRREDESVIGQQ